MQNRIDDVLTSLIDESDVVLPRIADARRAWLVASGLDEVAAALVADQEWKARLAAINDDDPLFAYLAEVVAEEVGGGLRLRLIRPEAPSFRNRRYFDIF